MSEEQQQNKPFRIKLHPLMDEKTLNAISDATLAAIDDQLYKSLQPDDIGKEIKGEGIYLGTYEPVDRDGVSLKKVFNVFAAPEDLPGDVRTYLDTVTEVSSLKNWHGHDGTDYATDKELYTALKDGAYNGGWIIPTRDILHGKDVDGKNTTPDNILAHKDKGSLKGTFKMATSNGSDCPHWYWSSTQHPDLSSCVYSVRFSDGHQGWDLNDTNRLSCRPVRLVVIK